MENEDAFATEAQDVARVERSSSVEPGNGKGLRARTWEADASDDEEVPLMSRDRTSRDDRPGAQSRKSYERAINQPWTGAQGSAGLPWYKQPSVFTPRMLSMGSPNRHRYSGSCQLSSHSASRLAG
jgi:hypothetical protein